MEAEPNDLLAVIKAVHAQAEKALDGDIEAQEALANILDLCYGPLSDAGYTPEDEEVLGYEPSDALGG